MVEVVDSIIADLEVRYQQYVEGFDKATAAHERFKQSVPKIGAMGGFTQAEAQQYADRHTKASDAVAKGEEESAKRVVRAKKTVSEADKAAAAATKAAAKEKADADKAAARVQAEAAREVARAKKALADEEARLSVATRAATRAEIENVERLKAAEAQATAQARASAFLTPAGSGKSARGSASAFREAFKQQDADAAKAAATVAVETEEQAQARLTAAVERGIAAREAATRRGGSGLGGTVSGRGDVSRQTALMAGTSVPAVAAAEVQAEKEVNRLLADQADLQAGLTVARGRDRDIIRDQLTELRLINQYRRAGLTDEEAAIRAEARLAVIEEERAAIAKRQQVAQIGQFGAGAGLGRFGGLNAATAGIAAAGAVAGGIAAVSSGIDYAKEIKNTADAVGLTTRQVQVYEAAARQAGVSTDQFRSGIGQLNSYLGRAKEGDEQAAKTFKALGVSIKDVGSAGDVLPTLIDRISSIKDPAQRAAVETRLFGEEGRRLDALLSGGNQKVGELAAALERTGAVLSSSDIAKLNDTEAKLAAVKAQLQVDLSQIVAGNADSILALAKAFAELANDVGGAIKALDGFQKSGVGSFLAHPAEAGASIHRAIISPIERLFGYDDDAKPAAQKAASPFGTPQPGKANTAAINNLFAPKPPKGKSANDLQNEADERTKRYNDQLAGFQEQQLRALAQQTGDINEQAAIESQLAERARQRQIADINSQERIDLRKAPGESELIRARAQALRDAATAATKAAEDVREQQVTVELRNQENQHLQTRLGIEAELLDGTQALARTSSQRLAIALRLLDIEKQQEKANLDTQIANAKPGTDTTDLKAQRDSLDQRFAGRAAAAREQNLTPGQTYLRSLTPTSDDIQHKQVALLERFNSGLDDSITKALHLHGIFGDIVKDLIDMAIKQALIKPLAGALFGGGSGGNASSGGGFGSLIGSLLGAPGAGDFGAIAGLAGGGSFVVGGNGGIDRNLLSINGKPTVRVNNGETIAVIPPNVVAANARVRPASTAMTLQQTINIDGRNSVTPGDFAAQIVRVSADHANRVAAQAGASAVQASPARVRRSQTLGD